MNIHGTETHEYANLFPMIEKEDLQNLKVDIKEHGLLQPIIMYDNKILDGRNRFLACKELNITPKLEEYKGNKPFEYVISTNLHRRHLSASQKGALAVDLLPIYEKITKERQKFGQGGLLMANLPQAKESIIASKEAGKVVGIGERYVREAKKIKEQKPEAFEEIRQGTLTIQDVKKVMRIEQVAKQRKEIEENIIKVKPTGKYDVIVIDPPWCYDGGSDAYDSISNRGTTPYPTMSKEEIQNIVLPHTDDSILWLWTTNKFLQDSFELLDIWGYELKTILTWDKEHIATGRWLRSQTEHCILAVKGKPFFSNTKWSTLIREKRTTHSKKPNIFYTMVDEICAGRKLDYFARENRKGWDVYGDEIKNE